MTRSTITLAVAGLALLAGCGAAPAAPGSPVSPAPNRPDTNRSETARAQAFNATDVMFAQMMIAHHGQGRAMVRLARSRPVREEVKTLAAAIEVTEAAEAEAMTGWAPATELARRIDRSRSAQITQMLGFLG